MTARYAPRLVAFIDILGSKELLTGETANLYAQALFTILSHFISNKTDIWFELPHVKNGERVEMEFEPSVRKEMRMTTISDAIAISFPFGKKKERPYNNKMTTLLTFLESVYQLQQNFLMVGLRSRGGVAFGDLYHNRSAILGEGLVKAYNLEVHAEKYPRVVVHPEIMDLLLSNNPADEIWLFKNRIGHLLRLDYDGQWFVDYLGRPGFMGNSFLRREIKNIFVETERDLRECEDPRIGEKLTWLYEYVYMSALCMGDPDLYLEANKGTQFGIKYQRTHQNLLTLVNDLKRTERSTS